MLTQPLSFEIGGWRQVRWYLFRSEQLRLLAYNVGLMFWLSRNRFVGSYLFFSATSRS